MVKSLKAHLAELGYSSSGITYLALLHYHYHHPANANEFARATWLVRQGERDAMFAEKPPGTTQPSTYSALTLLSCDLYHYSEERSLDRVPAFEFNPEQTRATRVAIDASLKKTGAQLWIQRDFNGNAKVKKAPNFYE